MQINSSLMVEGLVYVFMTPGIEDPNISMEVQTEYPVRIVYRRTLMESEEHIEDTLKHIAAKAAQSQGDAQNGP